MDEKFKLVIEIPITLNGGDEPGEGWYDLDFKNLVARTNLPKEERYGILESLGQSDYIYGEMAHDMLGAFDEAPVEELDS